MFIMKKISSLLATVVIACATVISFTGCDLLSGTSRIADPDSDKQEGKEGKEGTDNTYRDKWYSLVNETAHELEILRQTAKYGEHTYTIQGNIDYDFETAYYDPEATAAVRFSHIPSGYTEFSTLYQNFLGQTLQGTIAMVPMAMEIYARDPATGEKCFNLLCKDEATVSGILRILKTKFPTKKEMENDSYCQRYLPAALLEGADYKNDYVPEEPFTVQCGAAGNKPVESKMAPYGTVYYTYIFADGWESTARSVDLFLPIDTNLYKIQGCSSCYVQCRNIMHTPWKGLK